MRNSVREVKKLIINRKGNMPDTFRKTFKPLTDDQKSQMNGIKSYAEQLELMINEATTKENGREMAVAKTNLETAIMWAVKGITK